MTCQLIRTLQIWCWTFLWNHPVKTVPRWSEIERVAPPHSFIHVDDFEDAGQLADYLVYLTGNSTAFAEYFWWQKLYRVQLFHGFNKNYAEFAEAIPQKYNPLCRFCELLHKPKARVKTARNLVDFWFKGTCEVMPRETIKRGFRFTKNAWFFFTQSLNKSSS